MSGLRERATLALREAMRSRDRVATSALRTLLSTFANAEAVPDASVGASALEAAPVGVGTTEATRRSLSTLEVAGLALAEVAEREEAAAVAEAHGLTEDARRLRREAAVIRRLLED